MDKWANRLPLSTVWAPLPQASWCQFKCIYLGHLLHARLALCWDCENQDRCSLAPRSLLTGQPLISWGHRGPWDLVLPSARSSQHSQAPKPEPTWINEHGKKGSLKQALLLACWARTTVCRRHPLALRCQLPSPACLGSPRLGELDLSARPSVCSARYSRQAAGRTQTQQTNSELST